MAGWAERDNTEQGQIVTLKEADWDAPYNEAVTATVDCPLGLPVAAVTTNVPVEAEAGIMTEGGTVRAGPSLETATVTPPAGAGLVRVKVQVLVEPAVRFVGSHDKAEGSSGLRFSVVVIELLTSAMSILAVMVTLWLVVIAPAVAVNVDDAAPAATDRDAGIASSELSTFSCTFLDAWTSRLRVTVQIAELPEVNDVGLQLKEDTDGAGNTDKEVV